MGFSSDSALRNPLVSSKEPIKEMQAQSLGREDLLEKEMATHSSILPGKSHGQGAWRITVHEVIESDTTYLINTQQQSSRKKIKI